MNLRAILVLFLLATVAAGGTALLVAQDAKQELTPEMEAVLKYAVPGEHHEHLKALIGTWETKTKFWPAPDAPVVESTGKAVHSAVLGGRFIHTTYDGDFMGQPFSGMGYIGYDNYKKQYTDVWMDTMGTYMLTSQGNGDAGGKVLDMRGSYDDPMTGQTKEFHSVYRFAGPDRYTLEMYDTAADGSEYKTLEIVHTRSNAGLELPQAERERGGRHLEGSRQYLLGAVAGLSEAQWNFKPAPERWSAAEIVEHLALSEDTLFNMITERVLKTPALTQARPDAEEIDIMVVAMVPDRSAFRAQAPKPVQPTGRWESPDAALEHFLESRAKTLEFLKSSQDLRAHAMPSPLGKDMDAYQWLLFISGHTERHTKQLLEVKADPNFPPQ